MSTGDRRTSASPSRRGRVAAVEASPDRRDLTRRKVIARLKALAPSLVASGALVDARAPELEPPPPPRSARDK